MLLKNFMFVLAIIIYLTGYVIPVVNERKRVFKFTKLSTKQNVDTTANPFTSKGKTSAISHATTFMQFGLFKCMEYDNLQNRFKSYNEGETVDSLITKMEPGWSFYYAKSLEKSYEECRLNDLGREYRGKKNTTATGIPCMVWTATSPHQPYGGIDGHLTLEEGPEILNTNYCRNPDFTAGGPWCYTMDPGVKWMFCGVPFCTCNT